MKTLIILCAACGVGKSTVCAYWNEHSLLPACACMDTDEVGINWWDYANVENPSRFHDDCIREAVRLSGERHLLFVSCMSPPDFYTNVHIPAEISATYFVAMTCVNNSILPLPRANGCKKDC